MQPRQRTTWKLTTISSIPPGTDYLWYKVMTIVACILYTGMNLNTAPEDVKVSKTSKSKFLINVYSH